MAGLNFLRSTSTASNGDRGGNGQSITCYRQVHQQAYCAEGRGGSRCRRPGATAGRLRRSAAASQPHNGAVRVCRRLHHPGAQRAWRRHQRLPGGPDLWCLEPRASPRDRQPLLPDARPGAALSLFGACRPRRGQCICDRQAKRAYHGAQPAILWWQEPGAPVDRSDRPLDHHR
jgi:hypothetical protein